MTIGNLSLGLGVWCGKRSSEDRARGQRGEGRGVKGEGKAEGRKGEGGVRRKEE